MQTHSTLDNYQILKTLGTGYTGKVKLGRDMESGQLVALKILDPTKMDQKKIDRVVKSLQNELAVMQKLDHVNIVKFIGLKGNGKYKSKSGKTKTVGYAIIELASKGEIFEVLFEVGPFNENLARFYMKQLVSALEYLHVNNIAHRDLKPENLLLDENLNLKLADFGFATIVEDGEKNKTRLGTERYMCPELFTKTPYDAQKADIFAAGVILFIFFSGHPPFHEGRPQDPYYNAFVKNRAKFWNFHSKQNKQRDYSESYKFLVSCMLEYNPKDRYSIEQVKNSEWLNEPIDEAQAEADMQKYMGALQKMIQQKKGQDVQGNEESYRSIDMPGVQVFNNNMLTSDYEKIMMKQLGKLEETEGITRIKCDNKEGLIGTVIATVDEMPDCKLVWNEEKTKFKIKLVNEKGENIMIKVILYQAEDGFGLRLLKHSGRCMDFYNYRKAFLDTFSAKL